MSLFKARDWWSTTAGDNEEYDTGCLCVANIDNSPDHVGKNHHMDHGYVIPFLIVLYSLK